MANNYLGKTGLTKVIAWIKGELDKKVDKVSGKGLSTNDYTATDKNKVAGIASGAQVNVLETVKVNGTALTPTSKAVNIDLSSYAKKTDVEAAMHYKGIKNAVSDLPATGNIIGDMWNVKSTGANYAWDGTAWDKLSENIDLSGLLTKTEFETYKTSVAMVAITDAEIDSIIAGA